MSIYIYIVNLIFIHCLLIQCCDIGQVEIDNTCLNCASNCLSCTVPLTCTTCMPGYFYRLTQCPACSPGCQVCNQFYCQTCFPKFYLQTTCKSCPSQCATCTSNTVCQSCVDGYVLIGNNCSNCITTCKTCSGAANTCTSCHIGYYLSGSQCFTCSSPCFACINDQYNCTQCIDSNKKAVNYQCVCNDGYYTDNLNQCQPCNSPCLKCEDNADKCIDCISTFTLSSSLLNTCECSFGYFQVDPITCQQCTAPCQTCEQNQNYCLSCVDVNQVVNEFNNCVCKTGWIYDTDGITCIQCQLPCIECVQSINKCIICKDEIHQQPDSCGCEYGWIFDNNYLCIPCSQPCSTCSVTTSQCLTCLDNNHELNNSFQCICKPTYYSDSLITCAKCNEPCYECDQNGCINCIDVNQILDSNHQCICKPGYILQGIHCVQCQKPCSQCIITINDCITCLDINQIVLNQKCLCKEGFIWTGEFCCDQYCVNCQGINNCINCMEGFYLSSNSRCLQCIDNCKICNNQMYCQICQEGYFLNQQNQCEKCIQSCKICGNPFHCDICFDGFYLLDQICEKCNSNCLTCNEFAENCINCRPYYEINNNYCVCKIGYYEQENQCFRCKYPCKICSNYSVCEECFALPNLFLDQNFECKCSQGYFWNQINCSQCQQPCLNCIDNQFNCLNCDPWQHRILVTNKCQCSQDYFESEGGICISCLDPLGKSEKSCKYQNCTDLIWTYGEECDDGNDVNRDGCSNCKIDNNYSCYNEILKQSICFQCSSNCVKCEFDFSTNKSKCTKCRIGYFLDKNDCVNCQINCLECADQAWNCLSCKFSKQPNQKCQFCNSDQGYYADDVNGICLTKCGDFIKVNEEECDDGNLIKGDGCDDQCKLEKQYIFRNGLSILPIYPKPLLQSLYPSELYSVSRFFKLSYNTLIFITEGLQIKDYLTFHFMNQNSINKIDQQFELTQEIIQINELNQSQLTLMINITFSRSSLDEILIIKFSNRSAIYSIEGYSQLETEVSCSIPNVIYIDDDTITQVKITTQSNVYILYFIGVVFGGSVLFGGVEVFFNLLDTLQTLSYLKYLNTQLPYNLQNYFELFGFAQFNFIQKIFDFSGFIEVILDPQDLKQIPTKVARDDLTPLFIINASTILTVWISLFGIYTISKIIPKILYQLKFKFYSDIQTENQILITFGVYYLTLKYFLNKICLTITSEFYFNGILRAHMATAYDFSFSVVLQLYALQLSSSSLFINVSSVLACMASVIYILIIHFVIRISQMKQYSFKSKDVKTKYGSVFEGIKINRFSKYFSAILLIKKLIFMVLLIFSYEFPTFQTCSITLLSIVMCLYFILFCRLDDKIEYCKQLCCEISISLTLLGLTILTCDFELGYFSYKVRQYVGWVCISLMTSILLVQLGIDSFQQWRFLYRKYKKIRRIASFVLGVFSRQTQVTTVSSNIFS